MTLSNKEIVWVMVDNKRADVPHFLAVVFYGFIGTHGYARRLKPELYVSDYVFGSIDYLKSIGLKEVHVIVKVKLI